MNIGVQIFNVHTQIHIYTYFTQAISLLEWLSSNISHSNLIFKKVLVLTL